MPMTGILPDAVDRERAATTFDCNVVVTAGAGTGKTRLLVERLMHLLMREPEIKLTDVVALTFTNKAAAEIRLRLRERLEAYVAARIDSAAETGGEIQLEVRSFMERYHLSKTQLNRRAVDALRRLERSEIGTIHSFAATLLRLYPMQSGVDPQFVEDDGRRFEIIFDGLWTVWLDEELSRSSSQPELWKRALRRVGLRDIRRLAFSLCSESVDLSRVAEAGDGATPLLAWLQTLEQNAAALLARHPEDRTNEKQLRGGRDVLQKFLRSGSAGLAEVKVDDAFRGSFNRKLRGWGEEDSEVAREIIRVAKALLEVDDDFTRSVAALLLPFAERFRKAYAAAGLVSFDGLLTRARSLVRDHPRVREQLKRRFKAILIDEFQDTDPVQYEIILYLAEETGRSADTWKDVRLERGKIFVVGDPKQSIYAFRRADIEAYLDVVEKKIKAQDGIECRLTTNFRSHGKILDVVNGVFERLIRPKDGLQPLYVGIEPAPGEETEGAPFRKVAIRRVAGGEGKTDNERARRLEAENLARWLDEEVLGKAEIIDSGQPRLVRSGDVALLFRKLTDIHYYIEPLRRRGLRYVVEGERHFYAVQEVIDTVNLLRAVDNPHDKLALVGVLRSPLGGLTDAEIYELSRRRLLDYTSPIDLLTPENVRELYAILVRLNREVRGLPVGEAVARVFESAPVRLLAAAALHGEQAVANLEKLRLQAEIMGREPLSSFKSVIARLESSVLRVDEETESALAEENLDAIRLLSIHKSKGLEFPVVVLAGSHSVPNQGGDRESCVLQDWSTGLAGLRVGRWRSLPAVFIAEKARRREREEQKRVLYVAMTRAREHLTISCAATDRPPRASYLGLLTETLGDDIGGMDRRLIPAGAGAIELQPVDESLQPPVRARPRDSAAPAVDWHVYAATWTRRADKMRAAREQPLFLSPTLLKQREAELTEAIFEKEKLALAELPLRIGELAHRFLEYWDFSRAPEQFEAEVAPFLDRWLTGRWKANRAEIERELREILGAFFPSPAYRGLAAARILGREVPLLLHWEDAAVMEGVIDLLYEKDGRIFIADYKSDRVEHDQLAETVSRYHHQVAIYSEAVRRTLNKDVAGFKLIFLRLGESVEALSV